MEPFQQPFFLGRLKDSASSLFSRLSLDGHRTPAILRLSPRPALEDVQTSAEPQSTMLTQWPLQPLCLPRGLVTGPILSRCRHLERRKPQPRQSGPQSTGQEMLEPQGEQETLSELVMPVKS